MGKLITEVKYHAEKIDYYYKLAGVNGYKQASYHWRQLYALMDRASRSKNEKIYTPVIQDIIKSISPMMEEMKEREKSSL